jgi:hypothetical protein
LLPQYYTLVRYRTKVKKKAALLFDVSNEHGQGELGGGKSFSAVPYFRLYSIESDGITPTQASVSVELIAGVNARFLLVICRIAYSISFGTT